MPPSMWLLGRGWRDGPPRRQPALALGMAVTWTVFNAYMLRDHSPAAFITMVTATSWCWSVPCGWPAPYNGAEDGGGDHGCRPSGQWHALCCGG